MRAVAFFLTATILGGLTLASSSSAQKTTGPKAQYKMDVSTMSGFGAGMGGGMMGGIGAIMGGGGNGPHYMLDLRLTSATPPPKQPETGDHFFLPAAKLGKSVPLLGDTPGSSQPIERDYPERDPKYEKPKGRILMFWGCHANAPKGQPFIIDFAKMPTAKMPAGMPDQMRGYRAAAQARDANAAWWPNGKNGKQPKSGSSLRGEHRVASTFTPEIKFALVNDYMGGLNLNTGDSGGAISLSWNALPTATGYIATAFGGMERAGQGGDMVMWTSANSRDYAGGQDWMSPAEVQQKINQKLVMPPSQTTCSIPVEAKTAAGGSLFGMMNAFGPEENFAYPPKPADPKAVWNIEWTTKARFRSSTSFFTGSGMGGMGGMGSGGEAPAPRKPKPCKGPFGVPIPGTSC
jgi:hypothetical protein